MQDVTRKRILRKLEALPEAQLYQVLDYIEFLEARYAAEALRKPDAFQQFAERVEDQMRVRSLAPRAMKGTMRIMSTAGRVIDGVRELGKDLTAPPEPGAGQKTPPTRSASPTRNDRPVRASGEGDPSEGSDQSGGSEAPDGNEPS